ncbi:hypothetical protein MJG53_004373 [Ovis ammon polii x Ovis aries]|uniref:Anaphase-promoting complex subunit 11 RING-H2 finger domain-containing protein n=3 Tax=Ovis TaxID=9935 RepID=A0A836AAG2_SHEEP|nr:hypothetical protein JEQ12_014621 [Ovis aries]KAI4546331.1 hypothetical protein MG293_002886 [Ovis ammon polii]KAI4576569.1 hypothetical protein MJT46_002404 [Ovis ammon polii x Ovis aries]KAI4586586.1 hypothetical protein MJG53_004373 [Ovis ammon polii x Ovis aries]
MVTWLWVATHEDYSIFPMAFSGSCLDIKMLSDDCLLLWGQCSYCFLMHNILKRLKAQQWLWVALVSTGQCLLGYDRVETRTGDAFVLVLFY